jgi:hypothetical protein
VTLLLGIVTPWGAWMTSDHRLTRLPGGQLITDTSVKHVGIKASNGIAVVTYTGIGRVGNEDMSDWLRTTLRGENRALEDTAELIATRASERFGRLALQARVVHAFAMAAFRGGQAFLVTIANTDTPLNVSSPKLRLDFLVTPMRVLHPQRVYGGGGLLAVTPEDRDLLARASGKRPRRPEEFLGLLAAVNRRAARSGRPGSRTMSAACVGAYLPPDGGTVQVSVFGDEGNERKIESPPFLLYGFDATEMERAMPKWDPLNRRWVGDWPTDDVLRRGVQPRQGP